MSLKLKPWAVLTVIFIVGAITGSALTIGLGSHFMHSPGPRDMKRHWMAHLTHDLNLTTDQQARIQPILADAETKIQALHRDEIERGSQILKATDDQISTLLTDAQKTELQKMEEEREKMFSGHMRPWGAPHDGPGPMDRPDEPDDRMPPPPPPEALPANAPAPVTAPTAH
jgi:Spy/CpxP family protein refolding chaperone